MLMFANLASAAFIVSRSALLPTPATHPSAAATAGTRACVAAASRMMAGMPLPAGSLVALATPMTSTGEVDIATLRELLRWHKAEGTDGVVILGTTGEASTLTSAEKEEVMAATREEVGGEMAILVGTGTISTEATIAATKQAKLFGADAALVVTPYYVKPSQAGLVA